MNGRKEQRACTHALRAFRSGCVTRPLLRSGMRLPAGRRVPDNRKPLGRGFSALFLCVELRGSRPFPGAKKGKEEAESPAAAHEANYTPASDFVNKRKAPAMQSPALKAVSDHVKSVEILGFLRRAFRSRRSLQLALFLLRQRDEKCACGCVRMEKEVSQSFVWTHFFDNFHAARDNAGTIHVLLLNQAFQGYPSRAAPEATYRGCHVPVLFLENRRGTVTIRHPIPDSPGSGKKNRNRTRLNVVAWYLSLLPKNRKSCGRPFRSVKQKTRPHRARIRCAIRASFVSNLAVPPYLPRPKWRGFSPALQTQHWLSLLRENPDRHLCSDLLTLRLLSG